MRSWRTPIEPVGKLDQEANTKSLMPSSAAAWVGSAIGSLVIIIALVAVVAPRTGEVGDALGEIGFGSFASIVAAGLVAMLMRTAAWQVAVDSAGGKVRWTEAHPASAISYTVGLLNPYLGGALRVALMRKIAPERVPTASQLVATEGGIGVVEAVLIAVLIVVTAWTLDVPLWAALLVFLAAIAALAAMAIAARRLDPSRFAGGLALARTPRTLGFVALALAGSIGAQLLRVDIGLASVGLEHSILIVAAVFVASGAGAVLPIGTAASGAAAPLLALPAGGDVATATAAGLCLSAGLAVACLLYTLGSVLVTGALRRSGRGPEAGAAD